MPEKPQILQVTKLAQKKVFAHGEELGYRAKQLKR
jgi:hypothetical protein